LVLPGAAILVSAGLFTGVHGLLANWFHPDTVAFVQDMRVRMEANESLIKYAGILATIILLLLLGRMLKDYQRGRVAKASGLFYCLVRSKGNYPLAWLGRWMARHYTRRVAKRSNILWVLGMTGSDTFTSQKSELHQAFLDGGFNIRVVLINPDSPVIDEVAPNLENSDPAAIRNQIRESIQFLKGIQANDPDREVALKVYEGYPHWKVVILDDILIMQEYPTDRDIMHVPLFAFQKTRSLGRTGMYENMQDHFQKYWNSSRLRDIDLNDPRWDRSGEDAAGGPA
jgi:hypothetical protein